MNNPITEERLAAALAGDQQAFSDVAEPYRAELLVHCYRLLASPQDAEDMVQETFLRAWKRLDSFTGGPYFRAWLYKIATNICLDALDKRPRRVLSPADSQPSDPHAPIIPPTQEPVWIEPIPDELLPDASPSPESRYSLRESVTLAFLAALQFLPPRQRVILILCDVLDWRSKEVAQLLEISLAAVNGLLRRARTTMKQSYPEKGAYVTIDNQIRRVLTRYVDAWESGDVDTLISLLGHKVVLTMPPSRTWYSGQADIRVHAERMFSDRSRQRWRMVQTRANGQPAFACYRLGDSDGQYHAHFLHVLSLDNALITEIDLFFLPHLFPLFGLDLILKGSQHIEA